MDTTLIRTRQYQLAIDQLGDTADPSLAIRHSWLKVRLCILLNNQAGMFENYQLFRGLLDQEDLTDRLEPESTALYSLMKESLESGVQCEHCHRSPRQYPCNQCRRVDYCSKEC